MIVQVSVHDIGPVGQESVMYTEKFIVPPDVDTSKSSRVYTLVIVVPSGDDNIGLSSPPNLDVSIVTVSFLNSISYGPIPPVGVASNVTVSPEYLGDVGHDANVIIASTSVVKPAYTVAIPIQSL